MQRQGFKSRVVFKSLFLNYPGELHCIYLPNVGQLVQATGITYYPVQELLYELLDCPIFRRIYSISLKSLELLYISIL